MDSHDTALRFVIPRHTPHLVEGRRPAPPDGAAGHGQRAAALGLRALAPWARHLQIATAAIGLLACPFTLASATVLLYMTRPELKAAFEGSSRTAPRAGNGADDATFALSIVGMLVLGLALAAVGVLVF